MNKRTLQEIFDAVIDAGYYPFNSRNSSSSSSYMCIALDSAMVDKVITNEEELRAKKSINAYIRKLLEHTAVEDIPGLYWTWLKAGITKEEFKACKPKLLACYRDWTNRPYAHRALKKNK